MASSIHQQQVLHSEPQVFRLSKPQKTKYRNANVCKLLVNGCARLYSKQSSHVNEQACSYQRDANNSQCSRPNIRSWMLGPHSISSSSSCPSAWASNPSCKGGCALLSWVTLWTCITLFLVNLLERMVAVIPWFFSTLFPSSLVHYTIEAIK